LRLELIQFFIPFQLGGKDAKEEEPTPEPTPAPAPPQPTIDLGPIPGSPTAAAAAVILALESLGPHPLIGKLVPSGPGFINIHLPTNYLKSRLSHSLHSGILPALIPGDHRRRVVIDYSSPNIAKEMHIGHLRSTIIGDALARILEYCGHEIVQRANHVGDWGTQFGMLLAHVKELLKDGKVTDEQLDASLGDVTAFYREAKKRFDADAEFKKRAHGEVVQLQSGDAENLAIWKRMVSASSKMFDAVYSRLGVDPRLELCGESFYNSRIPGVVTELQDSGICESDQGALIIRVPESGQDVPVMLRKSDGGFGYDGTDMAALKYRLKELKGDWLIYVVDSGQALHFELVFGAGRRAGWYDPVEQKVQFVGFGVILGEDGKKLKTRSGDSVRLVDVLDEAKERAVKMCEENNRKEDRPAMSPEEIEKASLVLGYGGMKYYDLKQNRTMDYAFSYDRMLSPDGNTIVYIEYAHARIESILRRAKEKGVDVEATLAFDAEEYETAILFTHKSELALAIHLCRWQEMIVEVQQGLLPHRLCEYVYQLAGKFSDFFRDCQVVGDHVEKEVSASRLRLCKATLDTMKTGMKLLGIEPLEKM